MEFKIVNDDEIPKTTRGKHEDPKKGKSKYPLEDLKVGQAFIIELTKEQIKDKKKARGVGTNMNSLIRKFKKSNNLPEIGFTTILTDTKLYVKRIK